MSLRSPGCQRDGRGADIFFQPMQLGGAGDRHDPGLLRQQPGQRDLRRRRALSFGDLAKQIDQGLVGLARLRRRSAARRCGNRSCRTLVLASISPVRKPLPSGLKGTKPMPSSSSVGSTSRFRLAPPQRIFALQRRDRLHRMGAADGLRARFRQAEMLDLAFAGSAPSPRPRHPRSARSGSTRC